MSTAIEFFAGSGLVGEGLSPDFDLLWANDNGAKKADVFRVNHPHVPFHLGGIEHVHGMDLPVRLSSWRPSRSGREDLLEAVLCFRLGICF
ncbi:MAG: hypothetical protein WCC26_08940 [Terracidiphilus sp.]